MSEIVDEDIYTIIAHILLARWLWYGTSDEIQPLHTDILSKTDNIIPELNNYHRLPS